MESVQWGSRLPSLFVLLFVEEFQHFPIQPENKYKLCGSKSGQG